MAGDSLEASESQFSYVSQLANDHATFDRDAVSGAQPMNTKNKKYDDLTSIKGIGSTRQEWFRNKLGVHTYQHLAALAPEKILSQLKSEGMIASQGEVERWISQAHRLAEHKENSSPSDWKPFASFVVEFQSREGKNGSKELCTTVQHMEADKEEIWTGIETERLCQWMRDQVGQDSRSLETPQHEGIPALKPLSIAVQRVQVFQPPQAEYPIATSEPGQAFHGIIKSDQLFDLLETFSIRGLDPGDLQQASIPYFVQFYARKLPSGDWIHLGNTDRETLLEGQERYSVVLPEISLSVGVYTLDIITRLESKPPVFKRHQMPMLHVA